MKKWMQPVVKWLRKPKKKRLHWVRKVGVLLIVTLTIPVIACGGYWLVYRGKIYPGIEVSGLNLNRYSKEQAWRSLDVLERDYLALQSLPVEIDVQGIATDSSKLVVWLNFAEADLLYDPIATTELAYNFGRTGDWRKQIEDQLKSVNKKVNLNHIYNVNHDYINGVVAQIASEVDRPGVQAEVSLGSRAGGEEIKIYGGENGYLVDQDDLKAIIEESLGSLREKITEVPMLVENNVKTLEQIKETRARAEKLKGVTLTVLLKSSKGETEQSWALESGDVVGFVGFDGGFDKRKIETYVKSLAEAIEREPQNATFKFENGRVVEFAPGSSGIKVLLSQSVRRIIDSLEQLELRGEAGEVDLAVRLLPPDLSTPDVNDLGIQELLGRGESAFRGSIAGRVHNVVLTASRLDGVLIPPGETFSFNQTIGDVSRATGYKTAYIIKDGRTILGDGGGVCQDSTTLFRAIMDAGLPIVERQAHAYRVSYYEQNSQPGFDATVYAPHPDLKFTNDTPGHVLIQAKANASDLTLEIELYGTSDGRKASIINYQKWDSVPAPPPLYQDDPTLGPGVIKQVDWASPGLKVKFDYVVTRDGETLFRKTFYSNYRPWQAVYLKGV